MAMFNRYEKPYPNSGMDGRYNDEPTLDDLAMQHALMNQFNKDAISKAERDAFGKYPKAKTFKDGKGNIREIGTGKIIRPVQSKKKAAPAQKSSGSSNRSSRSSGPTSSASSKPSASIGGLGEPDTRNVSKIVDSLINDATKQYRWANEDARRQAMGDMSAIGGGTLALDRMNQAAAASNQLFNERIQKRSDTENANELAFLNKMRADLESTSQTGGTPLEYAAQDAELAGENAGESSINRGTNEANNAFYQMARAANAQMAQEGIRSVRSGYAQTEAENNRLIAAERAKRAALQREVEKGLWDEHIAKKMAEAELLQRDSSLQNDAVSRYATRANTEIARQQAKDAKTQAAADRSAHDYEVVQTILWGLPGGTIEVPVGTDKNGKPIYEKRQAPSGQASTYAEALQRMRAAGLSSPEWIKLASDAWKENKSQSINNIAGQIFPMISGSFGGM